MREKKIDIERETSRERQRESQTCNTRQPERGSERERDATRVTKEE